MSKVGSNSTVKDQWPILNSEVDSGGSHSLDLSLRWKVDYLLRRVVIELQPVPQPPALCGGPAAQPVASTLLFYLSGER